MRILIDHCVDWRLKRAFPSHDVKSTQEMGWEVLQNGELLKAAGPSFDVFLTVDRNIRNQQNLSMLPIAVVVLIAASNRTEDLQPLAPTVELSISSIKLGQLVEVSANGATVVAPGRDR